MTISHNELKHLSAKSQAHRCILQGVLAILNVDVEDGMVNGAECHVRHIEKNPANESFPKCIWIEFIDSAVGRNGTT